MWNYRIIFHDLTEDHWYGIHEVYYDEDGFIYAYSSEPCGIIGDSVADILKSLELLRNVMDREVIVESEMKKALKAEIQ